MKKLILIGAIGLVAFTGCGVFTTNELLPVPTFAAETMPTIQTNNITVRGTVESIERRNVYSTLGKTIDRVYAEEGDIVTAGQILARLDTADLELTIAQQRATLEATRQTTQNAVSETQRMLNEATANLANNTNMHILTAEASLNAAAINLELSRQNYENAVLDLQENNDPHVLAAESLLRTVRTELETMEQTFDNTRRLYEADIVSSEEMRQMETAMAHVRNQYADANISFQNITGLQQRAIDQLRTAHDAATTSHRNAQELLNAARAAANQEIEMLRAGVATAEIAANLEPMEIAIRLLERQLEDSLITAPIDGTITAVLAREGAAGMGLMFVVEDVENLRVITSFREYDIARVQEGMVVAIVSDAVGGVEHSGVINRINPAASPFSPIVEFEAEVLVTSPNAGLRIGMNTRVEIELN